MRRFYAGADVSAAAGQVRIGGALAHRLSRVLRLATGDELALFDGRGQDTVLRITAMSASGIDAVAVRTLPSPAEPHTKVTLYQSITRGERFEWLLEKATEIGVTAVVPLIAARAVVKPDAAGPRIDRWRRILIEAAEQCERGAVPALSPPTRFPDALAAEASAVVLIPYEAAGASAPGISTVMSQEVDAVFASGAVSLLIGPEGGFEPAEVEAAIAAGAHVVTLGERVLRSETAGIVAATLVLQAAGELG